MLERNSARSSEYFELTEFNSTSASHPNDNFNAALNNWMTLELINLVTNMTIMVKSLIKIKLITLFEQQ